MKYKKGTIIKGNIVDFTIYISGHNNVEYITNWAIDLESPTFPIEEKYRLYEISMIDVVFDFYTDIFS